MYKRIITVILICMSVGFTTTAQSGNGHMKHKKQLQTGNLVKHHVVIQLSSSDTLDWKGLMGNIKHLKEKWADSISIEVVAHSGGIEMLMLKKTTQQKNITAFKTMGVVFVGCENTMRQKNITKDEIIPEAGFVPSGVGEIIIKQEQGWSYLKAGL
ncbi:hypothetical protein BH11BAC3_BH11BAC3_11250 [soil metagenome]